MSDIQYRILLDLYHEYNEVFRMLPAAVILAFKDKQMERATPVYAKGQR